MKLHGMKLHGMADAFRATGNRRLACALAQKACRDGFSVLHKRTTELFRELAVAHVDGSIGRVLLKLSRVDVLVLDDFAMAPLKDGERHDLLEICDDRYQRHSLILTSQMPNRLVHNTHFRQPLHPISGLAFYASILR